MGCETTLGDPLFFPFLSFPPLPLLSPLALPFPTLPPPLELGPLIQLGLGSTISSPAGSGAEPQQKLNYVHFSLKI